MVRHIPYVRDIGSAHCLDFFFNNLVLWLLGVWGIYVRRFMRISVLCLFLFRIDYGFDFRKLVGPLSKAGFV